MAGPVAQAGPHRPGLPRLILRFSMAPADVAARRRTNQDNNHERRRYEHCPSPARRRSGGVRLYIAACDGRGLPRQARQRQADRSRHYPAMVVRA
ncbi:hypothetical protein G6F61_014345 [Rhizopus arrhizus]|nr:hypothetical protein G6F61_014345 [Rhizopus arrhizus]